MRASGELLRGGTRRGRRSGSVPPASGRILGRPGLSPEDAGRRVIGVLRGAGLFRPPEADRWRERTRVSLTGEGESSRSVRRYSSGAACDVALEKDVALAAAANSMV